MYNPPLMVEDEFRGLHEIALLLPPGTKQIPLLAAHSMRHREGQAVAHFFGLVTRVMARRHYGGFQRGKRVKTFSVAI